MTWLQLFNRFYDFYLSFQYRIGYISIFFVESIFLLTDLISFLNRDRRRYGHGLYSVDKTSADLKLYLAKTQQFVVLFASRFVISEDLFRWIGKKTRTRSYFSYFEEFQRYKQFRLSMTKFILQNMYIWWQNEETNFVRSTKLTRENSTF